MRLQDVDTPLLVVDLDVLERNVREMADVARRHGVALRPHAKTHKSVEIAKLQLGEGAAGLTLAKLGEVEALLDAGLAGTLTDVLIAYPIVGQPKLDRLLALAELLHVSVSLDGLDAAAEIGRAAHSRGRTIDLLVEVDTGGRRCGVLPGPPAVELARAIDRLPGVCFRGIMTHEGHAYGATSPAELATISRQAGAAMVETAQMICAAGLECPVVSAGSTPSARAIVGVPGITEVRPGTYVFQDYNQVRLGVAEVADCAATVLATVVARPTPDRAVVDAGTKAVGADRNMIRVEREGFGLVKGQPGWFFARASEEHGVLLRDGDGPADDLAVGQRVEIIPNHICPAVNLYDTLVTYRGERVVDSIAVVARGRSR
ncbi:MAG: alanine racemase [Chloroflexota bacterium]|nr:alanine racemase [Chloroflexota bacterium]